MVLIATFMVMHMSVTNDNGCCAATSRCFAGKLGMQPDRVLLALMDDRMVAKGLVLQWVTAFFQDYLATDSMDDLVSLLRKARLDSRLMDFFPPHRRTLSEFDAHFKVDCRYVRAVSSAWSMPPNLYSRKRWSKWTDAQALRDVCFADRTQLQAAKLEPVVDYNKKKVTEVQIEELKNSLTEAITADPPLPVDEILEMVQQKKKDQDLPDAEIVKARTLPPWRSHAQHICHSLLRRCPAADSLDGGHLGGADCRQKQSANPVRHDQTDQAVQEADQHLLQLGPP